MNGPAGYRIKASVLRAYRRYLAREQLFDAVVARVSPVTAELLQQPPLPSTWVDGAIFLDVQGAIESLQGLDGVLRMSERTLRDLLPTFTGALTRLLTLFGTSPATLFSHLEKLVSSSIEGCEYHYQSTGARSGVVTVTYPAARQIPARSFYTTVATFKIVLELCRAKGEVGLPQPRGPNSAAYVVRW